MGHHPLPSAVPTGAVIGTGSAASSWVLIIFGLIIIALILYFIFRKKK